MIKTTKINNKLSNEERETILVYDNIDKAWIMDSTIAKHFNKALKQGWTPISQSVYEDDTICGMVLTAPAKAITIRNPNKKRVMSELQMGNLHGHGDDEDDEE
jgi:hypothetical protein